MNPPDLATVLGWIVAILFGALIILGVLVKHVAERLVEKIDSIPDKDWFDKVEAILDALPTPTRIEAHLTQGHKHASLLQNHSYRLEKLEKSKDDHETRIREVESK